MSGKRKRSSDFDVGSSSSVGKPRKRRQCPRLAGFVPPDMPSPFPFYDDLGDCSFLCEFCGAFFWYSERVLSKSQKNHPCYSRCCRSGTVILPYPFKPPVVLSTMYADPSFRQNIRAYNSMFAMTSFGAEIDEDINKGTGPYVFKLSSQVSHWVGSFSPEDSKGPRFLQLYMVDTDHELSNRLSAFRDPTKQPLDPKVVQVLMDILTVHNEYVQTFKTVKEIAAERDLDEYSVCLFNDVPD